MVRMVRTTVTPERAKQLAKEVDWEWIDSLTDEDIARQVAENPDAAPIPTIKQRLVRLVRSTKMPARRKIKLIRRYLRMSQSEFAEAYGIPVRTLQNWEAGRREPKDGILSYLSVIADMPDQVRRSLRKSA